MFDWLESWKGLWKYCISSHVSMQLWCKFLANFLNLAKKKMWIRRASLYWFEVNQPDHAKSDFSRCWRYSWLQKKKKDVVRRRNFYSHVAHTVHVVCIQIMNVGINCSPTCQSNSSGLWHGGWIHTAAALDWNYKRQLKFCVNHCTIGLDISIFLLSKNW